MSSYHAQLFLFRAQKQWKLLPWHSRQIGPDLGNRIPEQFLYLLLRQARHLDPGYPGQFAAHHLGVGQGVSSPPFLADVEVVEALALAGMPQLSPPLAHRDTRPPLRPPVRAVIGPRRGTGLPLLHLHTLNSTNPLLIPPH